MNKEVNSIDNKEHVLAGVLGALIFAVLGGSLWVVLYLFTNVACASGVIIAILTVFGYRIFAKKKSIKGLVISLIISLIAVVLTSYVCLSLDIFCASIGGAWCAADGQAYSMPGAFSEAYTYLSDKNIAHAFIEITGIGIATCLLGYVFYFVSAIIHRDKSKGHLTEESDGQN